MSRAGVVRLLLVLGVLAAGVRSAAAIEMKISAQALERTLRAQLFNAPEGRYYMRGGPNAACYVYGDSPKVSFHDDRVVVHIHTRAKLGTSMGGICFGVPFSTDADVSFIPEAQGQSIGFRDARIERLSESRELNFLLIPFLSGKLPTQMTVNAEEMMRRLLSNSVQTTGYAFSLDRLKLHSMMVQGQMLVVDLDADVSVN